ncbi:hypothetical protein DSO57_1035019 [Entomophthora muscae]|uniref:Uncharacterized protein n=1 Tax=Entomophthora muscae TaxID=34485 RepID=A0ACC2UKB3_9FUNG|nr:hypothetical protein DSO57_1035019 [Entomophthora muscae]
MSLQLPPLKSNPPTKPTKLPPLRELISFIANPTRRTVPYTKPPIKRNIFVGHSFLKRPRRSYNQVKRIYSCTFPSCNKAYGALNHLNAHILTLGHGSRRCAKDFPKPRAELPA